MDFKDSRAKGNKTPWPVAQARSCFIMLIFWCSVCLERVFGNLSRKMQMVLLSCKTMQKDLKPIISSCKGIHQHKFLLATSIHSLLKEDITAWIKRDGFTEPGRWNGVFVGSSNLHPAVFILQGGAAQRKMTNKVLKTHDSCCNKKGFQKSCCTTLTGFLWSCFRPWFPSISKKKSCYNFVGLISFTGADPMVFSPARTPQASILYSGSFCSCASHSIMMIPLGCYKWRPCWKRCLGWTTRLKII